MKNLLRNSIESRIKGYKNFTASYCDPRHAYRCDFYRTLIGNITASFDATFIASWKKDLLPISRKIYYDIDATLLQI
jgi:hypothetical protein